MIKYRLAIILILPLLLLGLSAWAYDSASTNYRLEKSSVNFSGGDDLSSTNYSNQNTLGEISSGVLTGGTYQASTGYRYMNIDSITTSSVLGCTNPLAVNYNSLATVDDGTCSYGGTGTVWGCTDPLALNYNDEATEDNGSCLYSGVPNVSNFRAVYRSDSEAIRLTWVNPVYPKLKAVIIRRGVNGYPTSPSDGKLIYNGVGQIALDREVSQDIVYYYTAFVQSVDNEYSSGVVTSESFNLDDDGGGGDGGDGGGGGGGFSLLPEASFVTLSQDMKWLFRFIQPNERIKTFDKRMSVRLLGNKDLTVLLDLQQPPSGLKTIGLTLYDPFDKTKTFSFLLHRTVNSTTYRGTIGPLGRAGVYPVDIYLIDYNNQTLTKLRGRFVVSLVNLAPIESIARVSTPIAVTGLAVGLAGLFYNFLLSLVRLIAYYFGRRRKGGPWGTVYDAVTKQPLDPVYITASQIDATTGQLKEVASAISDIDGRFSFFLPPGNYQLQANKTHYLFPSKLLAGKMEDEIYNNLYFGDQVVVRDGQVVSLNIPMDPLQFDWNEFAKSKSNFFRFYTRRKIWLNRLWKLIFVLGFSFSLLAVIVTPSWWNMVMVVLYIVLYLFNRFWPNRHRPVVISSVKTGEPLPFAIVKFFLPEVNQQIKSVVADKYGRIFVLVRPGVYYYTVEEKLADGNYKEVFRSSVINLPKGVLTSDIFIS